MTAVITQGLSAQQRVFQTIQGNIANAGVAGYSEKQTPLVTDSFGTRATGVQALAEIRLEDVLRTEDVREKVVGVAYLDTLNGLYKEINRNLGKPGDSGSLGHKLAEVKNAISSLETNPSDASAQRSARDKLVEMTEMVNRLANFVQGERLSAENGIDDGVKRVNDILKSLEKLNGDIAIASGRGEAYGNMKDKQDVLMKELSQYIDISFLHRENGSLDITTKTGQALLLQSGAKQLVFSRATSIGPTDTPLTLNKIEVSGIQISDSISSGKLGAYFKQRDDILPKIQEVLDEFTIKFTDHLNAIHNRGTAFPPPNQLTGTRQFADPTTETIQMTGLIRIGIIDQTTGQHTFAPVDLDFTAAPRTINDVAADINAALGVNGTAIVTVDGRLQITATNGAHGIGIVSLTNPEAVDTTSGQGFSHHFGLNDIVVRGQNDIGAAQAFDVNATIKNDPKLIARTVMSTDPAVTHPYAIRVGSAENITNLLTGFDNRLGFAAAGDLSSQTSSAIDYINNLYHSLAVDGKNNELNLDINATILTDSEADLAGRTGVDMQKQYENILNTQTIFAALSRMLKAEDEMFKILTNI